MRSSSVWRQRMANNYSALTARWRVPMGFGFAIAYLIFSWPTLRSLVIGGVVALSGLVLRALAAGHIQKSQSLATAGPFAYTRNPLYLGTFLLGAGFVIASRSAILAAVFVVLFVLVYVPVMRSEENFLRQKFGQEFDHYARAVPLFFPRPGRSVRGEGQFRWKLYVANREYQAMLGYIAAIIFLALKVALR